MIRLALAIGFLAVFGFVAYVIIILLINKFAPKTNIGKKTVNKKVKVKQVNPNLN